MQFQAAKVSKWQYLYHQQLVNLSFRYFGKGFKTLSLVQKPPLLRDNANTHTSKAATRPQVKLEEKSELKSSSSYLPRYGSTT